METETARRIAAVRRFNRFYTQRIGVLHEGLLDSPFSLTEMRVLYELAHQRNPAAHELARGLGLDAGYLSRILQNFKKRGLLTRTRSAADGRQSHLTLTAKGRNTFAPLEARSCVEVGAVLEKLTPPEQIRLVEAMQTIEHLLSEPAAAQARDAAPYLLRTPQPGDLGWVVQRHGAIYAQEYGYDEHFEALTAKIVGQFVARFEPKKERCWIAERNGQNVGAVFLVKKSAAIAKLRLLLVEPAARGLGVGARLVNECERFARQAGYKKIVLWTQSELLSARRIYAAAGYRQVQAEPHHSFGKDLVAETWELKL